MLDIFSPSFLMYLGIILLVVAILVVYFESKLREQNHKISSMFSIISTLAEDMNQMKFVLGHVTTQGGSGPILEENMRAFPRPESEQVVEVSDDEESEDNFEEGDLDESDEESDESESDSDEESEDESTEVKVLKISNENHFEEQEGLQLDEIEDACSLDIGENDIELLDEPVLQKNTKEADHQNEKKTISIDLEEGEIEESIDYKKLPLQKLKSIVVEKGLVTDTSKFKKPELLKLLGIE
jgi:hypothetical protein